MKLLAALCDSNRIEGTYPKPVWLVFTEKTEESQNALSIGYKMNTRSVGSKEDETQSNNTLSIPEG